MSKINKKGQALVEYILIVGLICMLAISLVAYAGGRLKDVITKSSCGLVEQVYVPGKKAGEGYCADKEE